ncbi:MAG: hypothetical protein ACREIA_07965 [Opitutaceae bacterium]
MLAPPEHEADWGRHRHVASPRVGRWDEERIGVGGSPIRTSNGWLQFYHGADRHTRYCSGALLLDLNEPWRAIARTELPIHEPTESYERAGLMPEVAFNNGHIVRGDRVDLFYGAADQTTCAGMVSLSRVLDQLT